MRDDSVHDQMPSTPDQALAELMEGNARFARGEPRQPRRDLARVRQVARKQEPHAAILGCADSRVPIEIVFDQGVGDVFVVRVAGNLAMPMEVASLEYAVAELNVQVVMVLGHAQCGAVKAALDGTAPGQITTFHRYLAQYLLPGIDPGTHDVEAAVRANVRFQVHTLRQASPVIVAAVEAGTLKIAGAVFDLTSGRVATIEV